MASIGQPSALYPSPQKRPRVEFDPFPDPMPKRRCQEPERASPHLSFLEEFCDSEASLDTSGLVSSAQEELVAEMMRSLEKVIGDGEEAPTLQEPSSRLAVSEPSSALATPEPSTSALDSTWHHVGAGEGHAVSYAELAECTIGELDFECGQASGVRDDGDDQIRHLLEASDYELGIPVTSTNSPNDASQETGDEWALLDLVGDDSLHAHSSLTGWLDVSFHDFEDTFPVAREFCETVMLF